MVDQKGYVIHGMGTGPNMTTPDTVFNFLNETTAAVSSSNLSVEEKQQIEYLQSLRNDINQWYIWVIFAFGFPGNLMSLAIILRLRCFGSPAVYVGTLAVVDNLAIVLKVLLRTLHEHQVVFGLYSCKILLFLGNFLQVYANWILVTMAIERFVAVWQPLHVASSWTSRRAALSLVFVMICTVALNAPVGVFVMDKPERYTCVTDPSYRSALKAWQWVQVVAYGFLPCTLLVTINILIIIVIRRATRHQRFMTAGSGTSTPSQPLQPNHSRTGVQSQVTALLVVTSSVLVLTTTPVCVYMLVQTWWKPALGTLEFAQQRLISSIVRAICDANHSVNFYLYFISARKFRTHFYNAICWVCMRSEETNCRSGMPSQVSATSRSATIRVRDRSTGYFFLFKRKRSGYDRCPINRANKIPLKDMSNEKEKLNGHGAVRTASNEERSG